MTKTKLTAGETGRMLAQNAKEIAHKQSKLYYAKVIAVSNRATSGIKCELVNTGEVVYIEAAAATNFVALAVDDYVWLKKVSLGGRNQWFLTSLAETSAGSHVPEQRADLKLRDHVHDGTGGEGGQLSGEIIGGDITPSVSASPLFTALGDWGSGHEIGDATGAGDELLAIAAAFWAGRAWRLRQDPCYVDFPSSTYDLLFRVWDGGSSFDTIAQLAGTGDLSLSLVGADVNVGSYGLIADWLSGFPAITVLDHFTTAALNGIWSWIIAPGGTVDPDFREHFLLAQTDNTQNGVTCFLCTDPAYTSRLGAQVALEPSNVSAGIRWDTGSDDTFIELYLKSGIGTYTSFSMGPFVRYQDSGGGITETQLSDPTLPLQLVPLYLKKNSTTQYQARIGVEDKYVININYGTGWTPIRSGLFVRSNTTTTKTAYFNWFAAS